MTVNYYGNVVDINYDIGDPSLAITLSDEYSIEDNDGNEYNVIPSDQFK